ncbi:MAG: methyltransferase domain-containing protein [Ruminococcaceae bacterium]|nr:methyltransferase domain-containing protein [Oscillospiraceae bacterium]
MCKGDRPPLREDEQLVEVNEHLRLIEKKNGLRFGTDAFLLSAFCRTRSSARAVELGTGSGIVSLLLAARRKYAHVTAVEVQAELAALAARNVDLNGFSRTVSVLSLDVRELSSRTLGGEVEAVLSNPPYMKEDSGYASPHDVKQAARHEQHGDIRDFAAAAARCLKYGGVFYTVYRPDRLDSLFTALRGANFACKRMLFVHDSPDKAPSMVLTEAKLGAAEGLTVLPPLFLHDTPNRGLPRPLSARAEEVYRTGEC